MDSRYLFVYAAVNVFCLVSSLILLSKFRHDVVSDQEVRIFKRMTFSYLGFVIAELLWALATGGILKIPPVATGLIKVAGTAFIPLMVYFWFWFAETRFQVRWMHSTLARILTFIPMAALLILYVTSFKTGLVFSITPEKTIEYGPLIGATGIVDNIYGVAIVIHALLLLRKETLVYRKREYRTQILFILICTAAGVIDAAVSDTPVMPLAIALAFLFLFTNLQEAQIFNDALTGLNNRRRADQFLEESLPGTSKENPFYLLMIDINNFKQINDTHGHLEGDRALRAVSTAIRKAADEYQGFVARWGGDEFIAVIRHQSLGLVQEFSTKARALLEEIKQEDRFPYPLTISIGFAHCDSERDRLPALISAADASMYRDKKSSSGLRASGNLL